MAASPSTSWIQSITAVSTTVAATLMLGFLGTFKELATEAPLIRAHMSSTREALGKIDTKQAEQSLMLAALMKDYASRDSVRDQIDKISAQIQQLETQQALLRQKQDTVRR